jgi:hypothetical protein
LSTADRGTLPASANLPDALPVLPPSASSPLASATAAPTVRSQRKVPVAARPTLGPARAPDQISKRNPYLH